MSTLLWIWIGHQYTYQSDINAEANDHPPVYYGWDAHNGV